jgi:hypothetical protein
MHSTAGSMNPRTLHAPLVWVAVAVAVVLIAVAGVVLARLGLGLLPHLRIDLTSGTFTWGSSIRLMLQI